MTTEQAPARRRPGRPLPAPNAAVLSQAHRLTNTAETGALLRAERAARGLSQAQMAARLGISRQTLVGLEAGAEGTAAGTLLRILADLGIVLMAFPAAAAADPQTALGLRAPPT